MKYLLLICTILICPNLVVAETVHRVSQGDTLISIADQYNSDVDIIQDANGLPDHIIYEGQQLQIIKAAKKIYPNSKSIGFPYDGRIENAAWLEPHQGYFRRAPNFAWGMDNVIRHLKRIVTAVRKKYPKIHALAVGDISTKHGGFLNGHISHQSGRDIDLGFYFKHRPSGYPKEFSSGDNDNLHLHATWLVLHYLAILFQRTQEIEMIYIDYVLQEKIYHWAWDQGVKKDTLRWMFQYPRPIEQRKGLIRHEPNHMNHMHVRFACKPNNHRCNKPMNGATFTDN